MLDDLKYIHERDVQDALGIAENQWVQLEQTYDVALPAAKIQNIVFAGMGGSALAALLSQTWPGYSVPFEICRSYEVPDYVSDSTLFIASSYSGNTEETLSALAEAETRGAVIAVITSGGKLKEIAYEKSYPLLQIPAGFQPRHTTLFGLKAIASLVANKPETFAELEKAKAYLKQSTSSWRADVPTKDNYAKQIALELMGKSIVVYSGPLLFPAAYKWKISCNENAKTVAWCNQLPEFNHNEFLGWTSHPVDKPYAVVDLRSTLEHERVQKRFLVSEKLLSGKRPAPLVVQAQGETVLEQVVWTTALGDFVSIYLALLNGLNPTPVDLIEKFKSEMNS